MKELSLHIEKVIKSQSITIPIKTISTPEIDGLNCDPCHHSKLYEDGNIRILDVVVRQRQDEPFHTHELPSVMYLDKPASIEYSTPERVVFTTPDNRQPSVTYLSPEKLHKVKNIDKKDFHAFRIEIKYDINEINLDVQLLVAVIEKYRTLFDSIRDEILAKERLMGTRTFTPAADCHGFCETENTNINAPFALQTNTENKLKKSILS